MNDTDRYPLFIWTGRGIKELPGKLFRSNWRYHHFVPKKLLRKYPELIEYQKLILLPCDLHFELHYGGDKFFSKYKTKREDLLFCIRKYREGYYNV